MDAVTDLLAELPSSYIYINPFKVAAVTIVLAGWAWIAAWVDKDTIAVNTYRLVWNTVLLGAGGGAAIVALFVPAFAIGYPASIVIVLACSTAYIIHRNGIVREEDRLLTPGHFKRLREEGFSGKKKLKEVKEKVRIQGHDKKMMAIPDDADLREQYRILQDLMFDALWRRASVIELNPGKEGVKVTYQVDGTLIECEPISKESADAIINQLKQAAGLALEEKRKPQRGNITLGIANQKHKSMVKTDGSVAGEKLTVRVFGPEMDMRVADLGLNPKQLELATATREITPGLILLSAPPKQGLTTTIYSFVRTHDRFLQNVQMLEFDKEIDVDNVTQKLYSPVEGKTFAEQLLKIVRSDPDILVLPELRDRESALVAAQAATQKQKVYVGVVANDAFDALRKWATLVGDRGMVARGTLAAVNQRLVRVLCPSCKEAYKPDASMMRKLNLPADKVLYRQPEPQYDKNGKPIVCQHCQGTGYVGRTAVYEWLQLDDGLREVLKRSTSFTDVHTYLVKKGALGLQQQALQKVLDGVTSIQEVARAVRSPAEAPRPAATAPPASGAAPPKAPPKAPTQKPAAPGGK